MFLFLDHKCTGKEHIKGNQQHKNIKFRHITRSHYPERASALARLQRRSYPEIGHSDAIFDLFMEARFSHLIALLSNFFNFF